MASDSVAAAGGTTWPLLRGCEVPLAIGPLPWWAGPRGETQSYLQAWSAAPSARQSEEVRRRSGLR